MVAKSKSVWGYFRFKYPQMLLPLIYEVAGDWLNFFSRRWSEPMLLRITAVLSLILTCFPLNGDGWDSPLPFLSQPSGTDLAAFSNPASATRLDEAGTGLSLGYPDSSLGPWEREWTLHHQEGGQALGLRLWEGDAKTSGDLGWTYGRDWMGWLSTGTRTTYLFREAAPDRLGLDVGIQLRPHPALLGGYWGESLWTSRPGLSVHRWSIGLRPFAAAANRSRDFSLGYGMDIPEQGRRIESLYLQIPLPLSTRAQIRWDLDRRQASLGLTFQATGQMALAWGLLGPKGSPGDWSTPAHREVAVRFLRNQKTPFALARGDVAELDLNHALVEGEAPKGWLSGTGEIGFLDLTRRMDGIEANPRIRSVIVKLGRARAGWGMGEEIRERLLGFRARGKRVVAYMEQATPLNYYLASAADVVAMQPGGHFAVTGFASEVMFYRGFFDKVGVEPQFLRHGKYKAFEEPYTRKNLSLEARTNLEAYLGSVWSHYLDAVSGSRKLSRDSLAKVLAAADINLDQALKTGLIDTLVQQDEVLELAGGKRASLDRSRPEDVYRGDWAIPPRIALVVVQGDMVMGRSSKGWLGSPELAGAQSVVEQLKRARLSPEIKAVVLRVESPGGSAQAADIMAREVELLRKAGKPVVASIGHMAASGGYYLVCGADRIYCAHNSAVGSIGILWGKFVIKGLQDKLGLTTETVKTAPHADGNSMSRAWDSSEVEVLQRHMDGFYERFISLVAAGRKLGKDKVDSLAQGRIFTGTQALEVRLVDSIGGLDAALREAARLAGIQEDRAIDIELMDAGSGGAWSGGGRLGAFEAAFGNEPFAGMAAEALSVWSERIRSLGVAQLWALSPELAGWSGESWP